MPGPSSQWAVGIAVEHDLDRHPLHDLDVVAGRVLRRQQREGGAAAGLEALHLAAEDMAGICVDIDVDRIADPHLADLGFLVIGGDPDLIRHQRHQRLADLDIVAERDGLVRDAAGHRGADHGVGEVEARLLHLRRRRAHAGFGRLDLCLVKRQLGLARRDLLLRSSEIGRVAARRRRVVVELLARYRQPAHLAQHLVALAG